MSQREELARSIFDRLLNTGVFRGPVNEFFGKSNNSYNMMLMIPATHDVSIRVFGLTSIYLDINGTRIGRFKSADELIEYLSEEIGF